MVIYNRAEGFTRRTDGTSQCPDGRPCGRCIRNPPAGLSEDHQSEITVTADDLRCVSTCSAAACTRDLQLELEVTQGRPELIQSVTATLSGIAGILIWRRDGPSLANRPAVFSFIRDGSKLTADARLLGTMGAVQTLVLDIVFTDGGRTQRTEVDLTEALADFNSDMTTAYRVTGTLETPVGMEEGKGEITGWETVESGDASAEM